MNTEQNTSTLFMRSIPIDVKKKFKSWCAEHNITMTEKIIALMKDTCDKSAQQ